MTAQFPIGTRVRVKSTVELVDGKTGTVIDPALRPGLGEEYVLVSIPEVPTGLTDKAWSVTAENLTPVVEITERELDDLGALGPRRLNLVRRLKEKLTPPITETFTVTLTKPGHMGLITSELMHEMITRVVDESVAVEVTKEQK